MSTSQDFSAKSKIQEVLDIIDPDHLFTPSISEYCRPKQPEKNLLYLLKRQGCDSLKNVRKPIGQIVMKDHGRTLQDLLFQRTRELVKQMDKTTILSYLGTECVRLLFGGAILKKHKLYHTDLHANNILVDPTTLELCMIDFGELSTNKTIYGNMMKKDYSQKDYTQIPVEMIFYKYIQNNQELVSSLIKMPKHIEMLIEKGAKTGRMSSELVKIMYNIPSFRGIIDVLDDTKFPKNSRQNLYSLRCISLLSIVHLLRKKVPISHIFGMTLSKIDSFSIGVLLKKFCYYMTRLEPRIVSTDLFTTIIRNSSKMCESDITKRINCKESLRNIFGEYKQIQRGDQRDNSRKEILLNHINKLI